MNATLTVLCSENQKITMADEFDYLTESKHASIQFCAEAGQTRMHLKNQKFDLVILDPHLPDATLEELMFVPKKKNEDTPVLLLTVRNTGKLRAGFKKNGGAARASHVRIMPQPFRAGEFERIIDELLHSSANGRTWS